MGIYSEENIAETLTAQAEVLAGGVLGLVNVSQTLLMHNNLSIKKITESILKKTKRITKLITAKCSEWYKKPIKNQGI